MSRIARAALSILQAGPVAAADLGRRLASEGVTRARDPGAAVRRALRDEPRVVSLPDGRLALIDQALDGVTLTVRVGRDACERGEVDTDGDLAPFALVGVDVVALPPEARPGDVVAVTLDRPLPPVLTAQVVSSPRARADDERELCDAIGARLARTNAGLPSAAPIARLAPLFMAVAAGRPAAFRVAGRPLTEALREGGWEVHLGWVGGSGTLWESLTVEEVDALEADVADLLAFERPVEAAAVQDRVVSLLRRYLPERVPSARRRLARVLARAGRGEDALAVLLGAFRFEDPEDRYEAALLAVRSGDVVSARRWANDGLARAAGPEHEDVAVCLDDLASDLDGQATFLVVRDRLPAGDEGPVPAERVARAIVAPRRSYLVEALVEDLFDEISPQQARALITGMGECGDVGRDACLACAAVLPPPLAEVARRAAGRGSATRDQVQGLLDAAPVGAWITSRLHAPDQQQLIVTVRKECGRYSPLVVLLDHDQLGGGVKDAFFLPDMAETRLRRELFAPMEELDLPSEEIPVDEAIRLLDEGLAQTRALGWELPSATRQPVVARIERWVTGRPPALGG